MAAPAAPTQPSRLQQQKGRFFLGFARLVQRVLAHRKTRMDVALRNKAMRAARDCGIDHRTIAREVGVSEETTRQALRREPTSE